MKTLNIAAMMAAAIALLAISVPASASETDSRIESSAKDSYVFKTYLKDDDVDVDSSDGVVTLTGTVSDASHKSLAQETVASLPGVKKVDNKLEVKSTPPAENSDAWLSIKVKTTLLFHRSVSAMTEVDTKDGVVTLKGEAANAAEKELTTEYAKDVEGVKDVNNMMTVSKTGKTTPETTGEKIDDASITAQVKMALLFHGSTSAISTSVTTNRGAVTVSGKADNAAERDLVTKLVNDVKGVESVDNRMTIGTSE